MAHTFTRGHTGKCVYCRDTEEEHRTTVTDVTDIELKRSGTMIGFRAKTPEATTFLNEELSTEGWQWMGPVLWVDHRYAEGVVELAAQHGLRVGS